MIRFYQTSIAIAGLHIASKLAHNLLFLIRFQWSARRSRAYSVGICKVMRWPIVCREVVTSSFAHEDVWNTDLILRVCTCWPVRTRPEEKGRPAGRYLGIPIRKKKKTSGTRMCVFLRMYSRVAASLAKKLTGSVEVHGVLCFRGSNHPFRVVVEL